MHITIYVLSLIPRLSPHAMESWVGPGNKANMFYKNPFSGLSCTPLSSNECLTIQLRDLNIKLPTLFTRGGHKTRLPVINYIVFSLSTMQITYL